jgi:hypothetical protein
LFRVIRGSRHIIHCVMLFVWILYKQGSTLYEIILKIFMVCGSYISIADFHHFLLSVSLRVLIYMIIPSNMAFWLPVTRMRSKLSIQLAFVKQMKDS